LSPTNEKQIAETVTKQNRFDTFRVSILALGHLVNDSYANLVPSLLPLIRETYGLTYAASGTIMTALTVTSSVIQPIFGYLADRHGRRWLVALSVAWMAVFMSLIGAVGYLGLDNSGVYAALLGLVALGGLGSAFYHPQASTMVPRISGDRKGLGTSIFFAGGNLGYAIMPVMVVPVTALWGLKGTLVLMIPGLIMALLLYRYAPQLPQAGTRLSLDSLAGEMRTALKPMVTITGFVCMRSWVYIGMITFLPLYLVSRGTDPGLASLHLFVLLLFGAAGGLIGGWASDRYGRKPILVWSQLACAPLLYLSLSSQGVTEWALTAMAGMALLASFSPTTLFAQDLFPRNQGMASGIIQGFAMGIGGLGVAVTGAIADSSGIVTGTYSLVALLLIGVVFALLLPGSSLPRKEADGK
jgi:MFS transporter, FSR family, fosmidomycin resistance protein